MDEDLVCGLIVTSVCDFYFVINWKETRRFFKTLYYLDVLFLEILMKSFFIKKRLPIIAMTNTPLGSSGLCRYLRS
jgi:hypothetical protein